MYTLGTAAKATGLAKSTIHRAIKSGKISAKPGDGNSYVIDPAELHRVFPPLSQHVAENSSANGSGERSATGEGNAWNDPEVAIRLARAEAEVAGLREILELERKRAEELKIERDRWAGIAEASQRQITHIQANTVPIGVPPAPPPPPAPLAVVENETANLASAPSSVPAVKAQPVPSRGWWPFRRAG
jgi:hypothetical protein